MRAIFYAPMKSPTNPKPSGDRTVARLLVTALKALGYDVDILEGFKSYSAEPSLYREKRRALLAKWEKGRTQIVSKKPDLWITYHSYYKAPDLIGPRAANELGVPYLIFEPSFSPARSGTCWDQQVTDARISFERADRLLPMKSKDVPPLSDIPGVAGKINLLPPFVPSPNRTRPSLSIGQRVYWRKHLGVQAHTPVLFCAAMMRPGKKRDSYQFLAQSLRYLLHLDWHLVIAGDGPEHRSIRSAFDAIAHRTSFLGQVPHERLQQMYAAADLFVWPGLGEAYGMVYLEAAAGGTPSIAVQGDGVREVIKDGLTGTLVEHASANAYALGIARLLLNVADRRQMGTHAMRFVEKERSFDTALGHLGPLLKIRKENQP